MPAQIPMNPTHANRIVDHLWLARPSTEVAPDLLGCILVRQFPDGTLIRGTIVETEAYGPEDPACHAYRRRSKRNEIMFGPAGLAYVYLIYGMYHCINIVTDQENVPSAVLIRALQLETLPPWVDLQKNRKPHRTAAGPGKICKTLLIDLSLNGTKLDYGQPFWLEHRTNEFQENINNKIITFTQTTRIGLSQGKEFPWRWYITGSPAVSQFG